MDTEGPILETLTRRLAETPEEFLGEPRIGGTGQVHVAAVAGDLLRALGASPDAKSLSVFTGRDPQRDRNRLALTLLLSWLLGDDWFQQTKHDARKLFCLLDAEAAELALQTAARRFVTDPERREELARFTLAQLGFRPAGETLAQAQDRLTTLSSAERARVIKAAQTAELRARQIREALARKAADESADKWTRE